MHPNPWFTATVFHAMAAYLPLSAFILYLKPAAWPYLLSIFSGLVIAFIDLGANEVQVPALLLLVYPFFAGYASPRGAWKWGVLCGMWVPLFEMIRSDLDAGPAPGSPHAAGSLLAIAFALAGSYGGSFIRTHGGAGKEEGTIP